jgi:hypothetical protein
MGAFEMRRRLIAIYPLVTWLASAPGPAAISAPQSAPTRAPSIQAVLDCRKIQDDAQRLACFDKAVAAVDRAETSGDLVTIDREQRRVVRRQAFGLNLPSLAMFDKGEKPEEVDRVSAVVAHASQGPEGKWTVTLDDGAVWRQTDDGELVRRPHGGSAAVIRKGMLGSFFMAIDGQPAIRVHRDN